MSKLGSRRASVVTDKETGETVMVDTRTRAFSIKLAELLDTNRATQSDLARAIWGENEEIGVDGKTRMAAKGRDRISKYVRGQTMPTNAILEKIAEFFEITVGELAPSTDSNFFAEDEPTSSMVSIGGGMFMVKIRTVQPIEIAAKLVELAETPVDNG